MVVVFIEVIHMQVLAVCRKCMSCNTFVKVNAGDLFVNGNHIIKILTIFSKKNYTTNLPPLTVTL